MKANIIKISGSKFLWEVVNGDKTLDKKSMLVSEIRLREIYRKVMLSTNVYYKLIPLLRYVGGTREKEEIFINFRQNALKRLSENLLKRNT